MCGFLVEFPFDNNGLTDKSEFAKLLALSKHRGPDNTKVFSGSNYHLGFNRLAILDLSDNGNQPKYSPSQRYHVVFNGEIYNYKELETRYMLKSLQSTSDTEVLIHLLDKLGVKETLKVLNGMFAIAVIDNDTNTINLARDFAGIKPLFYGVSERGLVAASQFNQVFKHSWFKNNLKLKSSVMKEYFAFGYMQSPNTIYQDIFQVKPGQCLVINSENTIETYNFCTPLGENEKPMVGFNNEKIKQSLNNAIDKQLVSDVPLACFLSGGIDSPLITAIAHNKKADFEAFTLSVKDDILDEGVQAKSYANELNINHYDHRVNESDLLAQVNNHFNFFGEPFGDYSSIPTYLITKKAKQKHTVMLSGDGGDELFFGYPRMLDIVKNRYWFVIPFKFRKLLIRLANKLGLNRTWAPFHYKTIGEWVMGKHSYIFKKELNTFFCEIGYSNELKAMYQFENLSSKARLLGKLRQNEFYGHLQRVLIKVDRMSMANSLEVRVPFLDKEVLRIVDNTFPESFDTEDDLKRPLKKLMHTYYSSDCINYKKQGFAVPIYDWLHSQLKADVETLVFNNPFYGSEIINEGAVKDYVKGFYNKEHNESWGVWHIYAWQKWAFNEGLI